MTILKTVIAGLSVMCAMNVSAQTKPSAGTNTAATHTKEVEAGKVLITQFDCKVCHNADRRIIGPAYKEIAQKYAVTETNIVYLSNKIIKGGSGVWGDTEMAAHNTLTTDQARKLAYYILSLK